VPCSSQVDAWRTCALVVVLVAAVAAASTTGVGVGASWFDEQRIILLVALAVAALIARVPRPAHPSRAAGFLAAALVVGLLSSTYALRPYLAAVEWSVYCLMALLVLSARAAQPSTVETTAALAGAIIPTAYVTGVVANYVSALLLDFPVGAETLLVGFANPRFPAQLQVLTIPLLPLAMQRAPSAFWRVCIGVVAALWWMCFIGSGSRTGWIAITFAAMAVSFFGAEGRRWLKWQLVFAVTGAMLWGLLFHGVPALLTVTAAPETGRFSDFSSVGARWKLWRISVESALAHPLLGLGPMHFAYVDNGDGAHPHNFWLQLAAEWGIPARC
jgi:O-antigen ligase